MRMFLSWMMSLTGGFAAFLAVAILVMLPFQAAQNRELLDRVKQAAAYQVKMGHLPLQYQYHPEESGLGKMWVDRLDECSDSFMPPRTDRFVIGFWQEDGYWYKDGFWWHCYAYPSGVTTLSTSFSGYLASDGGEVVLILSLIAAAAFWGAARLRRTRLDQAGLRPITKAACFGGYMVIVNAYMVLLTLDDEWYLSASNTDKWFVKSFDLLVFGIEEKLGNFLDAPVIFWFAILFLCWSGIAYGFGKLLDLVMKLSGFRHLANRAS